MFVYKLFMSWNTIVVNAIRLMMSIYCVKNVFKLIDNVGTTIEKYLNEFKPVVHAKRWNGNKH